MTRETPSTFEEREAARCPKKRPERRESLKVVPGIFSEKEQ
jgi:hypothetical protein